MKRSTKGWAIAAGIGVLIAVAMGNSHHKQAATDASSTASSPSTVGSGDSTSSQAGELLASLTVSSNTSKAGYSRAQFGPAWELPGQSCDTRDLILQRDVIHLTLKGTCEVTAGTLFDPYTGQTIPFQRGPGDDVQIDHVVPLGDAWISGASRWSATERQKLANDPLELLAVDAHNNEQKSDSTADQWMPPYKGEACSYVARQIAVKVKYRLAITPAEHSKMASVLATCPGQSVPTK